MADSEQIAPSAEANVAKDPNEAVSESSGAQYQSLAGDKEELQYGQSWKEIEVAETPEEDRNNINGLTEPPEDEQNNPDAAETSSQRTQEPLSPSAPQLPEKDEQGQPPPQDREEEQPTTASKSIGSHPSTTTMNGTTIHQRSDSQSTQATNGTTAVRRSSAPLSSIVFVVSALDQIAASKEARRKKELGDAAQKALDAIKRLDGSPPPEVIFEPLRLATETSSIPLTTTALDCIGKLISYSYFSVPPGVQDPNAPPSSHQQLPLIDRAIETICDCFQNEATPYEIQLQIVKSLLAAVLNDKLIVHGSGLLKAVRQVYNIFLLSKSNTNQQVAQGTLTQMVGTVFERVMTRLSMKEARLNLAKIGSEKGTVNGSTVEINGSNSVLESGEGDANPEPDGVSEANSTWNSDQPVPKEPGERLTLQSLENAKSFDDRRIGDNAPTMVTPAKSAQKRAVSGQASTNGDEEHGRPETPDEDEEDEIFVKDAFLVFRSMCRLSHKELPPDQQQDIHSSNMRSKMISLAIIRTTLNNNMAVFTSPLCTIRGTNNEPTSFGQAINQYLRLSVSRNGASSVRRVFEITAEIFWLMLKDMRVGLKVCLLSMCLGEPSLT